MTPPVDIVIVNWNAGDQLRECLASIDRHHDGLVASVTVVDNGSSDGSDVHACSAVPFRLIRAGHNLGFAAASNLGASTSEGALVLLLNPDTKLLPGSLEQAVEAMAADPGLGVVGLRLVGDDGEVQRHCARLPAARHFLAQALALNRLAPSRFPGLFLESFDHLESRDVDHVIGAFYLVRRALWDHLGGLDERFFVYLEDLDFSLRVRNAGFRVRYLASATIFHRGGGTSRQVKGRRLSYALGSRLLYAGKNLPPAGAAAVAAATLAVEPLLRLADQLRKLDLAGAGEVIEGYLRLYHSLPALVSRARRSAARTHLPQE
jgi:GT2 family glycosyltransferase